MLVLNAGSVIEFDTPQKLYMEGGAFRGFMDEAGLKID